MRQPITIDDVLNSKMIAQPLRLLDCSLVSDGGAAPAGAAYKEYIRTFGAQLFGPTGNFAWETTDEFFCTLEAQPASVNIAALIPHAAVRYRALGSEKRAPAEQELARMQPAFDRRR